MRVILSLCPFTPTSSRLSICQSVCQPTHLFIHTLACLSSVHISLPFFLFFKSGQYSGSSVIFICPLYHTPSKSGALYDHSDPGERPLRHGTSLSAASVELCRYLYCRVTNDRDILYVKTSSARFCLDFKQTPALD